MIKPKEQMEMLKHTGYFLLISALMVTVQILTAQEVSDNEEITVEAPYQPSVSDAFKVNISPRIPEEKLTKPEFKYDIVSKSLKTKPELEPIVPARIEGESVSKLQKNYIRIGVGNYATPYLEFFANKLRSKKGSFGVHLRHLSSSGKIKDYAYPGNSHTQAEIYGKKFLRKHTFSAEAYAKRDGLHFYGYKPAEFPAIDLEKKDIKQNYTIFGAKPRFESNYTSDRLVNHSLSLGYYYLFDKYDASEHNIDFNASIDRKMEFFSFSDFEKLGIDLGAGFYLDQDSLKNYNSGIIHVKPFYNLQFDQYLFKVGINTDIESDTVSHVHFYPVAHVEVKVVQDHLITYAGIKGHLEKNSLKSFSDENPFIISTIEKRFTNDKIDQYGGIKGHVTKYLDYNLGFLNSTYEDMPFFVNDTVSALGSGLDNQFTVVYDKVKYTRINAEFGFHYKSKFNAMLRGFYNNYFLDNEDKPWQKPELEISLTAGYNLQDKILLKAELYNESGRYAKLYEANASGEMIVKAVILKDMTDLNFGIEYRYSPMLSGFIHLNNILGQRYDLWYNYPSYRFNVLLGVTYSF